MIYYLTFIIIGIAILGISESFLLYYVKKRFNFKFPQRDIDNRISVKKLRFYLNNNEVTNEKLVTYLKFIITLNFTINLFLLILVCLIIFIFIYN
jgi:hypothetical protein